MRPVESFVRKNVTEVGIDSSEHSDAGFDPKRDMTQEDMERIRHELDTYRLKDDWWNFSNTFSWLRDLDPTFTVKLNSKEEEKVRRSISVHRQQDDWLYIAMVSEAQLGPAFDVRLTGQERKDIESLNRTDLSHDVWWHTAQRTMLLRQGDPVYNLDLVDRDRQNMQHHHENNRRRNAWFDFAVTAAAIRELDPSFNPQLTNDDWDHMRQLFDGLRHENQWSLCVTLAAAMQKLSAAEAQKVPLATDIPPVPETKSYTS